MAKHMFAVNKDIGLRFSIFFFLQILGG
jgi:hypothetical protein